MKNKLKYFLLFIILIVVFGAFQVFYQQKRISEIKSSPVKYAYGYFGKDQKLRSIVYINSLIERDSLEEYYQKLNEHNVEPILPNNIRLQTISPNTKLFITEFTNDSIFAKFHAFYDGPLVKIIPKHRIGWVKSEFLHDFPIEPKGK